MMEGIIPQFPFRVRFGWNVHHHRIHVEELQVLMMGSRSRLLMDDVTEGGDGLVEIESDFDVALYEV